MSEPVSAAEFSEIQQLVRQGANEVATALQADTRPDFSTRYSLGHVACALVDTEGVEAAHDFASSNLQTLNLRPGDEFGVWADLYKNGDERALPKARRAAGIASEQLSFVEEIGAMELGGLHSAERLVELVEAGDTDSMALARGMSKNVYVIDRAALFGKLYRAGDNASLDLAIAAAQEAKVYTEMTGDQHYHRSDRALIDMASYAIEQGKTEDALTLIDAVEGASSKTTLHILFFKHGRTESLEPVLNRLKFADTYEEHSIHRGLAAAGYMPSVDAIRQRVGSFGKRSRVSGIVKRPTPLHLTGYLQDLTVLHAAGVEGADKRVAKLVETSEHPEDYLHHLGYVGLHAEGEKLAEKLYKADPTPRNAEHLLYHRLDTKLWRQVFNYWLHERNDTWQAASWVKSLASHARTIKNA